MKIAEVTFDVSIRRTCLSSEQQSKWLQSSELFWLALDVPFNKVFQFYKSLTIKPLAHESKSQRNR